MRGSVAFPVALAAFVLATCHRDPPPREPAPTVATATPNPTTPAPAPVSTDPSAATPNPNADAGDAATTPDGARKPPFGPAPSTTPRKILCGDRMCNLGTEVCCEDEHAGLAECVPKPPKNQYACEKFGEGVYERHCDEMADCPRKQSCCVTWGCTGGCPPIVECTDVPCLHGQVEQCLPGGACSPGFSCVAGESDRPGSCSYDKAGVACGGKLRCSAPTPVCCWNTKTRTGECARDCGEEPDEDRWALRCTTPDDCGGYPCANVTMTPLQFTTCLGSYDVPDRSNVVFCRTLADCPTMNMLGKPKACVADRSFPGKAKVCQFTGG